MKKCQGKSSRLNLSARMWLGWRKWVGGWRLACRIGGRIEIEEVILNSSNNTLNIFLSHYKIKPHLKSSFFVVLFEQTAKPKMAAFAIIVDKVSMRPKTKHSPVRKHWKRTNSIGRRLMCASGERVGNAVGVELSGESPSELETQVLSVILLWSPPALTCVTRALWETTIVCNIQFHINVWIFLSFAVQKCMLWCNTEKGQLSNDCRLLHHQMSSITHDTQIQ